MCGELTGRDSPRIQKDEQIREVTIGGTQIQLHPSNMSQSKARLFVKHRYEQKLELLIKNGNYFYIFE